MDRCKRRLFRAPESCTHRNPFLALEGNAWGKLNTVIDEWKTRRPMVDFFMEHGPLVNFTRPEKSECLNHYAGDEERRKRALKYIQEASDLLKKKPRIDQTNTPIIESEMDILNQNRWNCTREENLKSLKAISNNEKHYQFQTGAN